MLNDFLVSTINAIYRKMASIAGGLHDPMERRPELRRKWIPIRIFQQMREMNQSRRFWRAARSVFVTHRQLQE